MAANETLPLRDAFAVLFFVSVGMLFDPGIVARQPVLVAAALERIGNGADQPPRLGEVRGFEQPRLGRVAGDGTVGDAQLIELGRTANPNPHIIARADSQAEVEYLKKFGADLIVMGEEEIARRILAHMAGGQSSS